MQLFSSLLGVSRFITHHTNFVCRRNYIIHVNHNMDITDQVQEYYDDGPPVVLIPQAVRDWLDTNMHNRWQTRTNSDMPSSWVIFVNYYVFYRPQDAVLFKLTWGGKS